MFAEKLDKSTNKKNKKKDSQKTKVINNFQKLHKLELGDGVAVSKKSIRNFNKGNVFIEDKLDLHGLVGGGYRIEIVLAITENGVKPLNKLILEEPNDFTIIRK